MDENVVAQKILAVLSNNRSPFATLRDLAHKVGFKTAHNKSFKEGLKLLIRKNIVELCQSGWTSEKREHQHPKGVLLLSDIYRIENDFGSEEEYGKKESFNPSRWSLADRKTHLVGLEKMPRISKLVSTAITNFFELCLKHRFTKAKETLTTIEDSLPKSPFYHGFFIGLNGIVVGLREKDKRILVNNLNPKSIPKHLRDFKKRLKPLHAPYDQGYFFAMVKYLTFLKRRYRL